MGAYWQAVSIRKLFLALVAIAVMFAPAFTSAGAALAAAPTHDMQMMEPGHCQSAPEADHDKAPAKSCCIAMCMALAVAPATPAPAITLQGERTAFPNPPSYTGHLTEIDTPPPRRA